MHDKKSLFERGSSYITDNGRPLECALYKYEFSNQPNDESRHCLIAFQNNDGGFGNALEPDIRLPGSSVLCTTVGLQLAVEMGLDSSDFIVQSALDYLSTQFDNKLQCWQATPLAVNDYPHAPWWHREASGEVNKQALVMNPGIEVASYFVRWGRSDFEEWLDHALQAVQNPEQHELLCLARLADTPNLSSDMRVLLQNLITGCADSKIESVPENWGGYCLKPLTIIQAPDHFLAPGFANAISAQLDFEEAQQEDSGAWLPPWDWGGNYPDSWQQARREWSGILTLDMLRRLKKFGRL